jgi:hypothetical protein
MIKFGATATLLVALAAVASAATARPPSATVTIALPNDGTFTLKPGPGVEAVRQYCVTCHATAYISTQPLLSKAQWTAEVTKMKAVYGAPVPDDQVGPIAEYLAATYGKP